jgi:hypothetical protein
VITNGLFLRVILEKIKNVFKDNLFVVVVVVSVVVVVVVFLNKKEHCSLLFVCLTKH